MNTSMNVSWFLSQIRGHQSLTVGAEVRHRAGAWDFLSGPSLPSFQLESHLAANLQIIKDRGHKKWECDHISKLKEKKDRKQRYKINSSVVEKN